MGLVLTTQIIKAQVPSYVPTNGLTGWWGFSGNANDSSTNANNGTVNGATLTTDRFGNANSAYSFNGISNYISVNNVLLPNTPNSYTISLWYKSSSFSLTNGNPPQLISDRSPGLSSYKYSISINPTTNNTLQAAIYDGYSGTGNGASKSNIVADNIWHNVVFTYDKSVSTVYLYIDNILVNQSGNVTQWSSKSDPTNIGYWNGFVGASGFFNGTIDDIGIWNRALTQDEINNLYNANICYQNITVTDTLIINTGILSYNPVTYNSTVTIYPNPAKDHITIDCGNLANVSGYKIKIFNELGQEVFAGAMNTQQHSVPLNTWTGNGLYLVKIYDASNNVINTKKIILQ